MGLSSIVLVFLLQALSQIDNRVLVIFICMSSIYESRLNVEDVPFSPKNPNIRSSMPFSSSTLFKHSRQPSANLGILNQFTLADLIDPRQPTLQKPVVQVLAKSNHNKIFFNNETLKTFQEYEENPIAFVAIYGYKDAGKSFWCDKNYELADVKNQIPYLSDTNFSKCIQFSNVPFTKGNIKIFLLDCSGFLNADLTLEEEIRLDTIMLLSSVVILLPKPTDESCEIMNIARKHFQDSQKRLKYSGYPAHKRSAYWPHSLYTLYRTAEPVRKDMQKLGQLFYDYNFSIIHNAKSVHFDGQNSQMSKMNFLQRTAVNQHYLRHISWVFRDIYDKIQAKKIGRLRITGLTAPQLMKAAGKQFNNRKQVQIQKITQDATRCLYDREEENRTRFYNKSLNTNFNYAQNQKGLPLDEVYKKLKASRSVALTSFDGHSRQIDPNSDYAIICEDNLNRMMKTRQKEILEQNKQKTQKYLDSTLPHIQNYHVKEPEDLQKFLKGLKASDSELQHGRSEIIGKRLKEACDITKQKVFASSEDSLKLFKIQDEITRKKRDLEEVEKNALYKNQQNKKVGEQLALLQTRNSKLTSDIESWMKRSQLQKKFKDDPQQNNIDDINQKKYQQLQKRKQQLEAQWKESKQDRQEFQTWHKQAEKNVRSEIIVSQLYRKVEEKQLDQSKIKNTIYQSKFHSQMNIGGKGAEKRNIGLDTIRKSRLTRS